MITKNKLVKTLSSNGNNNFMTQTRFYRSKLNPDELSSNYAKEKIKAINSTRNYSYSSNIFKNISNSNFKEDNKRNRITHSVSNLDRLLENNKFYNGYSINYKNNITELSNNVYNEILYINNLHKNKQDINNNFNYFNQKMKKLDTYKTTCSLKKIKSYSNLQNLLRNSNNNRNDNKNKLNDFLKNYNYDNIKSNLSELKSYRFSSYIDNNSFNNFPLNSFNIIHNNFNNKNKFLCDKCLKGIANGNEINRNYI